MASGSCYEYTLRVAYLQGIINSRPPPREEKPTPQPLASTSTSTSTPTTTPSRRSYHDGSLSQSFRAFDLSSLMGGRDSRSPKYPEKLLKVIDTTLQRIAMGQESKYSDQKFRRSAALFWSSTFTDKTFQKTQRDSRKIEDLILPFVTCATKSLKKDEELGGEGAWKWELNSQIGLFLDLLVDCLGSAGGGGGEVGNRLEGYRVRLREPEEKVGGGGGPGEKGDAESVRSFGSKSREEKGKGRETENVGRLFGVDDDGLVENLRNLQGVYTEQVALEDLKTCLKRLKTESPFPYTPQDFTDHAQWLSWRESEISTLTQLILQMMQINPTLVQSSERDRSSTSTDISSRLDTLKLDTPSFTFIPPDPRSTYAELLSRCLDWDLEVLKTLPEDEDVSLGILSAEHSGLLGDCALRWRLGGGFRAWVFLEAITERFALGLVPAACVHEAMAVLAKLSEENSIDTWAIPDREALVQAIATRNASLLEAINTSLTYPQGYHSPDFQEAVADYQSLEITESTSTLDRISATIIQRVRDQAFSSYINEAGEKMDVEGGKNRGFVGAMAGWVEKEAKRLSKKFGEGVNEMIDVVPLVLSTQLGLWFRDLEDVMAGPDPGLGHDVDGQGEGETMEEAFALYRRAVKLIDMGNAFSKEPLHYPLAQVFEGTVRQWLNETALKTRQWADQALAVDNFEPTSENGPSSSVTDLFDSFRSAADFITSLRWPDEHQLAFFSTRLAKIFSLSINDYCSKMEGLFAGDMRADDAVQPAQAAAKQKAWVEKAKSTLASLQGEKKIQAFFNFTAASCVKLNNVESARQQLDRLYQDMRVDDLSAYDTSEPLPTPENQKYLFTVKIVLAEGLSMEQPTKLPDSFVIISDEHGNRYAKTRTIYDDTDPRWDETFDIPIRGSAWFMATVRHRTLAVAGKHDLLGRAYLRLDPRLFEDLISKDMLLPLDTRGHLLLRVSMEGERDDIQFHFGRAFRWLKRTESDMVRTFVDKMTPVLRHTLSRVSIKSVLKPGGGGNTLTNGLGAAGLDYNDALGKISAAYRSVDYNEALGKLSAVYRSAIGTPDYAIPLPPGEQRILPPTPSTEQANPISPSSVPRKKPPTDAEIEAAIHPLFDYLEANNSTLSSTLSRDAMQSVMSKLWKQILMTIEALIVPPLSDKPSMMKALSDGELDIALRWLKFLRDFLHVGGHESGVPLSVLQNAKFNEIMSVRIYYDWSTDDLMEECIRGFQSTLKYRATRPSKSLVGQRNLGTIKARKTAKRNMPVAGGGNTEMIMRILRMRQGTQEFLAQQIQTISVVKMENPKKGRSIIGRR